MEIIGIHMLLFTNKKTKQNHTKTSALIEENVLKIVSELWDTLKIPFTENY